MSWETWLATMEQDQRVSYAPLDREAVPQIQMVARVNLRNALVGDHDIRATCPMHAGDPTRTTLRVNLDSSSSLGIGFFKCYSCGAKGHWNKMALHLGIDPLVVDTNPMYVQLATVEEEEPYQVPNGLQDWPEEHHWHRRNTDGSYTTIPSKVFRLLGAKLWHTRGCTKDGEWVDELRAWVPVRTKQGRVFAHVAALLSERYPGSKKYLNSSGAWARKYIAMSTAAQELAEMLNVSTVLLVEGPADAMRLMALGIPAMPLLGIDTWTETKSSVIAGRWKRALVCLDADEAGRRGQQRVLASLALQMDAAGIDLAEGQDPASLDQRTLLLALGVHGVRPHNWKY